MAVFITNKGASRTDPAWQDLDEINGAANKGVQLAADITTEKAQVLFVDIESDGFIAMHSQPERSVCYIVEGKGTILVEGQRDIHALPAGRGAPLLSAAAASPCWRCS